jgi:hypothetical protein
VSGLPVLAVALTGFHAHNQVTGLPPVRQGQAFWVYEDQLPGIVAAGIAQVVPPGTPYPKPLPGTVVGWPDLGAATANSSS